MINQYEKESTLWGCNATFLSTINAVSLVIIVFHCATKVIAEGLCAFYVLSQSLCDIDRSSVLESMVSIVHHTSCRLKSPFGSS